VRVNLISWLSKSSLNVLSFPLLMVASSCLPGSSIFFEVARELRREREGEGKGRRREGKEKGRKEFLVSCFLFLVSCYFSFLPFPSFQMIVK